MVPCHSIKGNKYQLRLAEIHSNLLRAPLTAVERLEHLTECQLLEKQLGLKLEHGGDRKSKDFSSGQNGNLKSPILSEAEVEEIGMSDRSKARATRFCKLLSAEERNRIKGTSVQNCHKDLFAIAGIGDIQQRTAVIDALSDAEKPAPSLYEAKYRAGLVQPPERDPEKEAEREAELLFRALFRASPGALERFLPKVAVDEPEFVDIMTEVVNRLKEPRS